MNNLRRSLHELGECAPFPFHGEVSRKSRIDTASVQARASQATAPEPGRTEQQLRIMYIMLNFMGIVRAHAFYRRSHPLLGISLHPG